MALDSDEEEYQREQVRRRLPEIEPLAWMVFAAASLANPNAMQKDAPATAERMLEKWKARFT